MDPDTAKVHAVNPPGWPADPAGWSNGLSHLFATGAWESLMEFVDGQRQQGEVFPATEDVFRAFELTPLDEVKFVILGQDPYHAPGQAHGLSFSVQDGVPHPPSLTNIFKELKSDVGAAIPESGNLSEWARRGGLLLNTVLTVKAAVANSHRKRGWEEFTDAAIDLVNREREHVAFVLWGTAARQKARLIDADRHLIVESAHPSPLSAYRGFFGSRPFSKINDYRRQLGLAEIDWSLD